MSVSPARVSAFRVLKKVEERHAYLHIALHAEMTRARLERSDAALASEIAFGVLLWRRLLDHWIAGLSRLPLGELDSDAMIILRMGLYQLRFFERVPAYAILDQAVALAKTACGRAAGFVNAVLRRAASQKDYLTPLRNGGDAQGLTDTEIALRSSMPDWLVQHFFKEYGRELGLSLLLGLQQRGPRTVRVNSARATRSEVMERLFAEGISAEPSPVSPYAIRFLDRVNPVALGVYRDGLCSLQGESSMLVAPLLAPTAGQHILDACAAPGGKATHIAELAGDKAMITAVDLHPARVNDVTRQVERLGLAGVRTIVSDARQVSGLYDSVLLDAPCSGLGAIARKPDIKWVMTPERMAELVRLQADLLQSLGDKVRVGGLLIYTTCTLSASENENQIERFLASRSDFELEPLVPLPDVLDQRQKRSERPGMVSVYPQDFGGDGFFIAKLRRTGASW